MSDSRQNRLANETSPYLLQHAKNPVDWYPWGSEALERAQREDRPVLLSIGYAACHWCHVMERESFENEAIARLMNQHFVCIKVDREERPDLDEIYMSATVALSGSGGWPMTVFLTPSQEPFFAGTYFPPVSQHGRPGFGTVLERISEIWKNDRTTVNQQAKELTAFVRAQSQPDANGTIPKDARAKAVGQLATAFDPEWGGFGRAPKFPPCSSLGMLLRHYHRTRDTHSLQMVTRTLDGMKNGGIYDHVAGGFARYSTDPRWLVPHFEKMLYDNAQLANIYLEAFQVTHDPEYRRVAEETLDYVRSEMQSPEGGYYSATDADSEGEEGKYFVWTPGEVREALGSTEDARRFCAYYDVTDRGNWEGKSVLNTPRLAPAVARELGMDAGNLSRFLGVARKRIYAARRLRVPPLLDDKIVTSWNGLMLGAMANGYRVLRKLEYLESAERAARFLLNQMRRSDQGLYRTARAGKAHLPAYLEDYGFFCDGLISLYEAGAAPHYLEMARGLAERMLSDFTDPEHSDFFQTAHDHEPLIARVREGHDGPLPNANAVAARALARLGFHLGDTSKRERARAAVEAYAALIERSPQAFPTALGVWELLSEGPKELVLVGTRGKPDYEALCESVAQVYLPEHLEAHCDPAESELRAAGALPLTVGKELLDGRATLYVCRNFVCDRPITDPAQVLQALEEPA